MGMGLKNIILREKWQENGIDSTISNLLKWEKKYVHKTAMHAFKNMWENTQPH